MLTTHEGKKIDLADLRGSVFVYDFIFTSCAGTCPLMTKSLKNITTRIPASEDVRFVSISVDPERDSPEILRNYAKSFGADSRWLFLTGEKAQVAELSRKGFLLAADNTDPNAVLHSERFIVVDRGGNIRGYFEGTTEKGVDDAVEAIRTLLTERS